MKTTSYMLLACGLLFAQSVVADDVIVVPARRHEQNNAQAVAWSADGKLVAAGFGGPSNGRFPLKPGGGGVIVWDAASGKKLQAQGEYGDIIGLRFTFDDEAWLHSRVYTPGDSVEDNVSSLVSVGAGELLHRWSGRDAQIAAVSPTQPLIAIAEDRDICRLFTLSDGKVNDDFRSLGGDDARSARCLAYTGDGTRLVAVHEIVTENRNIVPTGLTVFETAKWTLRKHVTNAALRDCTALAVTTDGQWIATGHSHGIVRIWDGVTLEKVRELDLKTATDVLPRFSPDGSRLAVLTQPANFPVWKYADTPSGFEIGREQVGASCDLVLFDTLKFTPQRHFRFQDGTFRTYHADNPRESRNPARFAFSPDGAKILVGASGVVVIDADQGTILRQFDAPAGKE